MLATIIISALLLAASIAVVANEVRKAKKGSPCSGCCAGCKGCSSQRYSTHH